MEQSVTSSTALTGNHTVHSGRESRQSGVSWSALSGGALAGTVMTIMLMLLGAGLGLTAMSPFHNNHGKAMAVGAIIWLVMVQWISSGTGGYIAGRLRCKWADTHDHEVFFRDTAHGFMSWALATLFIAVFAGGLGGSLIGNAFGAGAAMSSTAAPQNSTANNGYGSNDGSDESARYFVDSLFRADHPVADVTDQQVRFETLRIIAVYLKNDTVPEGDKSYLAQLVSARTGLSVADAQTRVNDVLAQAHDMKIKTMQAADEARKAAAKAAIFGVLAMFVGAFIATLAAVHGGHHRDLDIARDAELRRA